MNNLTELIKSKSNISIIMILTAVLGYVLVLCGFFYEEIFLGGNSLGTHGSEHDFFNNNPRYILWLSSLVIQPVIWALLLFPATAIIIRLKNELRPEKHIWISFILLLAAFAIFIYFTRKTFWNHFIRPESSMVNHGFKLLTFQIIAQIVGLYYLFGTVLISKVCMKNLADKKFDVGCYQRLRYYLDTLINFTGIIFSLGTISSILLSRVINSDYSFPAEFVISFGLMNSIIILMVYLPAHFILFYFGRHILENKYALKNVNSESDFDLLNKQNEVSKNLNLSLGITQTFKTALVILSPVISSLIPKILDFYGK